MTTTLLQNRIQHHFQTSIETKQRSVEVLTQPLVQAAQLMFDCLQQGGKL